MFPITEYYVCTNNSNGIECKRYNDFNYALVAFRRKNKSYLSIKEFNSTIIPICILNPFKIYTLRNKLSKQFNDLYIKNENILII